MRRRPRLTGRVRPETAQRRGSPTRRNGRAEAAPPAEAAQAEDAAPAEEQRGHESPRPPNPHPSQRLLPAEAGWRSWRHRGDPAGPGRERHRGHGESLAQAGRRLGRDRRAAAGGLHRQGRHRDPLPGVRHLCWRSGCRRTRPSRSARCWPSSARRVPPVQAPEAAAWPTSTAEAEAPTRRPSPRRRRRPDGRAQPEAEPERKARADGRQPPRRERCAARAPPGRNPPATAPVAATPTTAYVTPLVRKLAKEHGVDLTSVTGTGVGGRIRKQDVLAAAEEAKQAAAAPAPPQRPPRQPAAAAPAAPARSGSRVQHAARHHREDVPAAQDHRQADGRVAAGLGPADRDRRGRPDRHLADPGQGQGRLQAARGREPVLPAVHHQGCHRGAEGRTRR